MPGAAPTDPYIVYGHGTGDLHAIASGYRKFVGTPAAVETLRGPDAGTHAYGAIIERRARTFDRFRTASEHERALLGEAFKPGELTSRLFRYAAICEAAQIVGLWSPGNEAKALNVASAALRSAVCFWLEDTDLSLPCIRSVVEQTSVARAWRLKPVRAERASRSPSPTRWIEAAGWRRAGPLARALGEFSHVSMRSRTASARRLLEGLQNDPPQHPEATARGHALDRAAYLLALEVVERLEAVDAECAQGFRDEVTLLDSEEHNRDIEDSLRHAQTLRGFELGDPDPEFGPPPE